MNRTRRSISTMILTLLVSGCGDVEFSLNHQGTSISRTNGVLSVKIDDKPLTQGSGHQASEKRDAPVFHKLHARHGIEVVLVDEPSDALTVEADDNLLPLIETKVENETLHVRIKGNLTTRNPIRVRVFTGHLSAASAESSASITAGQMHNTRVELKAESSGRVIIDQIEGDRVHVTAESSGEVVVRSVAIKTLEANVSSSAQVAISGVVDEQQVTVSSSGTFDGTKLIGQTANVEASSSGTAILQASNKIFGSASSSGRITYVGQPAHVQVDTSSSGTISKQR